MMGFMGFFRKEIMEILKTSKKIVVPSIFLFFGFLSPISARYMKEIIGAASPGLELAIPDPQYMDSFIQYFKNIGQMGIIVLIIAFAGTVVEEKTKGSAILVLTKSVSRTQFIISKFLSSIILFSMAYLISTVVFLYYTYILFPGFTGSNVLMSLLMPWIYGIFITALTVFASTVSRTHTMAAITGFGCFAVISIAGMIPRVEDYLPTSLNNLGMKLLAGTSTAGDIAKPVLITVIISVALVVSSIAIFKKQEL